MLLVGTTPFSGLLALFFAVPFGILCSIYGAECASTLRHRHDPRPKDPARPGDLGR